MNRVGHQDFELVPVLRQQLEFEAVGNRRHVPRLGLGLESAHDEAAHFLLVVDEAVGIANHRKVGRDAGDRPGDDVEVLGGVERHVDAGAAAELARPLAAAIDQGRAANLAGVIGARPRHSGNSAVIHRHAGDLDPFDDPGAAHPRALGQRLRQVGGVGLAVAGNPHGAGTSRRYAGSVRCVRPRRAQ